MPIVFPETQEVKLAAPPLHEVICQVRFPPILRIASQQPTEFQERIRSRFPVMDVEHGVNLHIPSASDLPIAVTEATLKLFRFKSLDGKHGVSLTSDFYAVSTEDYTNWDTFADMLTLASHTVNELYAPPLATRIGLRYINHLTLGNTGRHSRSELFQMLRPEATALFRGEVWQNADNAICLLTFSDGQAQLNLRLGHEGAANDPRLILDFDYFEAGQVSLDGLVERCYRYHTVIYQAFRWCLLAEALPAFQPLPEDS